MEGREFSHSSDMRDDSNLEISEPEPESTSSDDGRVVIQLVFTSHGHYTFSHRQKQIMVNFDNGAVPALLSDIKNEFHISPFEEGLVAGLQYVGLTGMSPISGMILQSKWKKQYILGTVVMLNGCAILLLPLAFS